MEQPVLSTEVTTMSQRVQSPEDREEQASCPSLPRAVLGSARPLPRPPWWGEVHAIYDLEAGMWHLCRVLGANRV